ncbi:MAG: cyclic nucleotide-gated ion channel [Xanthobacteraceae bacterium]
MLRIGQARHEVREHRHAIAGWRRRVYEILERGAVGDRASTIVVALITTVIVLNLFAVTFESVPRYQAQFSGLFRAAEIITLIVLTVEFAARLWVAIEFPLYRHLTHTQARLRYLMTLPALIDLVAILPFWLALVLPVEFQVLQVLRVIRILKLGRYSPALRSLLDALYAERRALTGCFILLLATALIVAAVMHLVEGEVQPQKFGTIPDAMWWAIVTLGTIGYGDVVPVTALGRMFASVTIFLGLIMIALPVGIVAGAFAKDIHRRDFVVTWAMVARVPLFAGLDANQIAEVMELLRSRYVEAGAVIARRGEPAHSMYFVAAGEVEIDLKGNRLRVGAGHFFGEVAVLRRVRRSATVRATVRTSLLVLDADDVHLLMDREPKIAERIHHMARQRIGHDLSDGEDILPEEILERESEPSSRI